MSALLAAATETLFREAAFLDTQRWDEWIDLYIEDSEFWLPAWISAHVPTTELSLMYFTNRAGLEERVWRARSLRAPSSSPLPRTMHLISNILLEPGASDERMRVNSNWVVHRFLTKFKESEALYGRYEHELVKANGGWKIAKKKVLLLNGTLPGALDFYDF